MCDDSNDGKCGDGDTPGGDVDAIVCGDGATDDGGDGGGDVW